MWGLCPGRELNPYKLALTAPSKLRVYQFHHPGEGDAILPRSARFHGPTDRFPGGAVAPRLVLTGAREAPLAPFVLSTADGRHEPVTSAVILPLYGGIQSPSRAAADVTLTRQESSHRKEESSGNE